MQFSGLLSQILMIDGVIRLHLHDAITGADSSRRMSLTAHRTNVVTVMMSLKTQNRKHSENTNLCTVNRNQGIERRDSRIRARAAMAKVWVGVLVIALLTRLEQQLMIPWRIMRPSIARDGEQLDPRYSTQTYHRPNQRTRPSPRSL